MALKKSSFDPFAPRTVSDSMPTEYDSDRRGMVFRDGGAALPEEAVRVRVIDPAGGWRTAGRWEPPQEPSQQPAAALSLEEVARELAAREARGKTSGETCGRASAMGAGPRTVRTGKRTFATVFPDLAAEWHPDRNEGLTPDGVAPKSNKKVWWRCPACGCEWEARVSSRAGGSGCPQCRRGGSGGAHKTAVECVETGEVFASFVAAAKARGLKNSAPIRKCVDDLGKTSGGYHWRRVAGGGAGDGREEI